MNRLAAALLLALVTPATMAQTVWRCESAGRTQYADTPCPGGRAVETVPGPAREDRVNAAQVVARDRALADRLRDERLALQREQQGSLVATGLTGASPAAKPPKAAKAPKKKRMKLPPATGLQPAAAGTSPSAALSTRSRPG